jgi:hypothetical protein
MSLGDRLRTRVEKDAAQDRERVERERTAKQEAQEAREVAVAEFLDAAKRHFTQCILADKPVTPVIIGRGHNAELRRILGDDFWNRETNRRAQPWSEYTVVWGEFLRWCASNGLEHFVEYDWDTGAIESWYKLSVRPKVLVS